MKTSFAFTRPARTLAPLALAAALYTAQFMHPSLRSFVKPVVEVMAALPSVVLGL